MNFSESTEESGTECFCGLQARLRVSTIPQNPFRLFYNCPKDISDQCGFFRWSDEPSPTGDTHVDELNLIRNECIRLQERLEEYIQLQERLDECVRLQERLDEIQREHAEERAVWDREKSELTSRLSNVQDELEDIKNKIKEANESDLMPPVDEQYISGDEDTADGKTVIVQTL